MKNTAEIESISSMVEGYIPLSDNVLILRSDGNIKTKGGIIIPDDAKEKVSDGVILKVGSGRIDNGNKVEMFLKVGDHVMFKKWGGDVINLDGIPKDRLVVMKESDILLILNRRAS